MTINISCSRMSFIKSCCASHATLKLLTWSKLTGWIRQNWSSMTRRRTILSRFMEFACTQRLFVISMTRPLLIITLFGLFMFAIAIDWRLLILIIKELSACAFSLRNCFRHMSRLCGVTLGSCRFNRKALLTPHLNIFNALFFVEFELSLNGWWERSVDTCSLKNCWYFGTWFSAMIHWKFYRYWPS